MKKVKAAAGKLAAALTSKQARPAEVALARIILAALGIKLGVNAFDWIK